ncbi:MAG: gliding motility lipoprotein GldH [Prevotella sp.]|nr:gliding motility lipoprotein GldH [Prevotella sp.]
MRKIRPTLIICTITIAMAFMASCNRNIIYNQYQSTNIDCWSKTDTLLYNIGTLNESGAYSYELGLRTTTTYPFTNICIVVEQENIKKNVVTKDTINCELTSSDGNTKSNGRVAGIINKKANEKWGLGYKQYVFPLASKMITENDSIKIKVYHIMATDSITGISDVGIRVGLE